MNNYLTYETTNYGTNQIQIQDNPISPCSWYGNYQMDGSFRINLDKIKGTYIEDWFHINFMYNGIGNVIALRVCYSET